MSKRPKRWEIAILLALFVFGVWTAFPVYNHITGARSLEQVREELKAQGITVDVLPPAADPEAETFANHLFIQTCYLPGEIIGAYGIGMDSFPQDETQLSREQIEFLERIDDSPAYVEGGTAGVELVSQSLFDAEAVARELELEVDPEDALEAIWEVLSVDDAWMAKLKEAAKLPVGVGPIESYNLDDPVASTRGYLTKFLSLARICTCRSIVQLELGESRKAYEELAVAFRLIELLEQEPMMLPHIVRMTMFKVAIKPVWLGLATESWEKPELMMLQKELENTPFHRSTADALWSDAVGIAGTLASPLANEEGLPQWPGARKHNAANLLRSSHELVSQIRAEEWSTPSKGIVSPELGAKFKHKNWEVVGSLYPTFGTVILQSLTNDAMRQCALAAIALELHCRNYGTYPTSLAELDGSFPDPFGSGSLHYVTKGQERYLLYSIGGNLVDDKGRIVLSSSGRLDKRNGDIAWTYPSRK